jgi:Stress responsive A/B Barrel Domain.
MIQHLVLFKFKEENKAENLLLAKKKSLALKEQIPQIVSWEVHLGAEGSAEGNHDFIIVSTFESMDTLAEYQVHPAHVAFGKFISELREARTCIDYEI